MAELQEHRVFAVAKLCFACRQRYEYCIAKINKNKNAPVAESARTQSVRSSKAVLCMQTALDSGSKYIALI